MVNETKRETIEQVVRETLNDTLYGKYTCTMVSVETTEPTTLMVGIVADYYTEAFTYYTDMCTLNVLHMVVVYTDTGSVLHFDGTPITLESIQTLFAKAGE